VTSAPATEQSGALTRHQVTVFALVGLAMLVTSMQGSTIAVALPDIVDDLHAPLRWVGWVLTVFSLAQAVSMPIVGKLSDELGRRTVFVGGLVIFAVSSVLCGVAPNIYLLIAARAVQGLAGGSLLPSAYGIIGDTFTIRRAQAIGMMSSVFPIGSLIGPTAGGVVVEHFGWRWTFLATVPLVIGVVALAQLLLAPSVKSRNAGRVDVPGVVVFSLAVLSLVYGLTELGKRDVSPSMTVVVASFAIAVVSMVVFLKQETRASSPLIDLMLLRRREFAFMNALNFFYGAGIFGLFSFVPLYAQQAYGMSHTASGALLSPRAAAMTAASAGISMVLPRTGYRKPILFGLALMVITLVVLSRGYHDVSVGGVQLSNFVYLSVLVGVTGVAFGISGPAANNAAIELAPDKIAAITGLRGMFRTLGGTLGTAVVVLIASRAPSEVEGLQVAFMGLAIVNLVTMTLVFGTPDEVGARAAMMRAEAAAAEAQSVEGQAAEA
jgi:EmrB/QacA subfamily drug resistance transporter